MRYARFLFISAAIYSGTWSAFYAAKNPGKPDDGAWHLSVTLALCAIATTDRDRP